MKTPTLLATLATLALLLGCSGSPDPMATALATTTAEKQQVVAEKEVVVQEKAKLQEQVVAERSRADGFAQTIQVQTVELESRSALVSEWQSKFATERAGRKKAEAQVGVWQSKAGTYKARADQVAKDLAQAEGDRDREVARGAELQEGIDVLGSRYADLSETNARNARKARRERDAKIKARWDAFKNSAKVAVCDGGKECEQTVAVELERKVKAQAITCMEDGASSPDVRKGKPAIPRSWKVPLDLPGLFRASWYVETCDPALNLDDGALVDSF